jgi:hypothetical protein
MPFSVDGKNKTAEIRFLRDQYQPNKVRDIKPIQQFYLNPPIL